MHARHHLRALHASGASGYRRFRTTVGRKVPGFASCRARTVRSLFIPNYAKCTQVHLRAPKVPLSAKSDFLLKTNRRSKGKTRNGHFHRTVIFPLQGSGPTRVPAVRRLVAIGSEWHPEDNLGEPFPQTTVGRKLSGFVSCRASFFCRREGYRRFQATWSWPNGGRILPASSQPPWSSLAGGAGAGPGRWS